MQRDLQVCTVAGGATLGPISSYMIASRKRVIFMTTSPRVTRVLFWRMCSMIKLSSSNCMGLGESEWPLYRESREGHWQGRRPLHQLSEVPTPTLSSYKLRIRMMLFFITSLCVYVYSCVYAHVCVWACMCLKARWHCLSSSIIFHFIFWDRQGVSLNLEFADSVGLAGHQASILLSLPPEHWDYRCMHLTPHYFIWVLGSNSGPHACVTISLPTKLSP